MTATAAQVSSTGLRRRAPDRWRGVGFGLALDSDYEVIGVASGTVAGSDPVRLRLAGGAWEHAAGTRLRELPNGAGGVGLAIDDDGAGGIRIVAPGFGAHHVAPDGGLVRSRPDAALASWGWQRLLVGQVLPLAAVQRGLEVLHASAVGIGGRAFALSGDPGAGKSTLAAHLALRGHDLVTDDVVAISVDSDGRPLAHRGSTALSLRHDEAALAARLRAAGRATATGVDDKTHLLVAPGAAALPLRAIYHLQRRGPVEPALSEPHPPSIADLVRASHVRYIETPRRRTDQLATQAAIARHCDVIAVNVDRLDPEPLAELLTAHMASLEGGRA